MPTPISSSTAPGVSTDPSLSETEQLCRAEPPSGSTEPSASAPSELPPAVKTLVSATAPATVLPPTSTASNNAERTTERAGIAPYAQAGRTAAGDPYVAVALLKGHDKSGFEADVASMSAQVGTQTELQVGLAHVGGSGPSGSVGFDTLNARVAFGIHNDDGSEGLNFAVQATGVGTDSTVARHWGSVTLGVSAGLGVAASGGLRDADHDGNHEICAKFSYDILTIGGCVETPL